MKKQDVINAEITRLYVRDGAARPSVVVEEARPEGSALHPYFEWNNSRAAEAYRLDQARKIIRVARVEVRKGEPEPLANIPVARVANVGAADGQGSREGCYKPVSIIAKEIDEFTAALDLAMSKLSAATRAVNDLKAAAHQQKGDVMARISVAIQAMHTAEQALRLQ